MQDMASRDVPLTAATTTSLVTVAGWAGQPERAKEIMSEMESLGVASNEQAWYVIREEVGLCVFFFYTCPPSL